MAESIIGCWGSIGRCGVKNIENCVAGLKIINIWLKITRKRCAVFATNFFTLMINLEEISCLNSVPC